MAGSTFGKQFRVTTFGESHGAGLGVVVDGVPAGLPLSEELLLEDLRRRRPGQSAYTTARQEADTPEILSGVFEGLTTGTPVAVLIRNTDAHSKDYSNLAHAYRPGHADLGFQAKYGIRDYRGGGRSSGRETAARVAAGAIARQMLRQLGITVRAWVDAIGPVAIDPACLCAPGETVALHGITEEAWEAAKASPVGMPDPAAATRAQEWLQQCRQQQESSGGVIRCVACGMPAGIGDPVFDKLDARLAAALFSIGAVKAVEVGDGFAAAQGTGSRNNDAFVPAAQRTCSRSNDAFVPAAQRTCGQNNDAFMPSGSAEKESSCENSIAKATNHAGGILGGMSDGSPILLTAAFKPTPSIAQLQHTVDDEGNPVDMQITGRHDPVIVPRAVVVVEAMTAITLADALLENMGARMEHLKRMYADR